MNLHRRVERLEETIGRLLLEKAEQDSSPAGAGAGAGLHNGRSNCCVGFPDPGALSAAERRVLLGAGSNCCVTFGSRGRGTEEEEVKRREQWWAVTRNIAVSVFLIYVLLLIPLLVWLKNRPSVVGCEACGGGGNGQWSAAGVDGDGAWSGSGGGG
jgi:hypothetical protein